ncbi:MAG: terminase large subunit domain-containing protein [Anaerolineae bacterium]
MLATDLRWALGPVAFAREALCFAELDAWQVAALCWEGKRALWNVARQCGKSTIAAVVGLHTALYQPGALVLLVSPSLRQSSELFRKVADLHGRLTPPPALAEDNRLSMQLANGSRVVSLPSSEATIRGYSGATLIVEDEAARVSDALYHAVRPMLATSAGRLILMSTPYGMAGHFYEEWTAGGETWERVRVTASECPRIPAAFLAEERRGLPDRVYRREYGCEFLQTDDSVFSLADFDAAVSADIPPLFGGRRP